MSDIVAQLSRDIAEVVEFDRQIRAVGPTVMFDLARKHHEIRAIKEKWEAAVLSGAFDAAR